MKTPLAALGVLGAGKHFQSSGPSLKNMNLTCQFSKKKSHPIRPAAQVGFSIKLSLDFLSNMDILKNLISTVLCQRMIFYFVLHCLDT